MAIAEAPPTLSPSVEDILAEYESERWFDVLASIKLFSHDLQNYGRILSETLTRVYDEELTFAAEAINRPIDTEFTLEVRNGEFVYFHKGVWCPYRALLSKGLMAALLAAQKDPRKRFEVERAKSDMDIGMRLFRLAPGEHLCWDSPFPREACRLYDADFVAAQGYDPARRLGFLYDAEKLPSGNVKLTTRSVDGDDEEALAAARAAAERGADIDTRRVVYDSAMMEKNGGYYYAGQRIDTKGIPENAWALVKNHSDLFDHYINKLKALAAVYDPNPAKRAGFERQKKILMYGTLAAFKRRLDRLVPASPVGGFSIAQIEAEKRVAYAAAVAEAQVFFGCGGALSATDAEDAMLEADPTRVRDMIFGKESKVMRCVNCPKCHTFHDIVRPKRGSDGLQYFHCKNPSCGNKVRA